MPLRAIAPWVKSLTRCAASSVSIRKLWSFRIRKNLTTDKHRCLRIRRIPRSHFPFKNPSRTSIYLFPLFIRRQMPLCSKKTTFAPGMACAKDEYGCAKKTRSGFAPLLDSNKTLISISVVIAIRQRLQVFNKIGLFSAAEAQALAGVIVVHNIQQGGKASIVIEAAFGMCPQAVERRCAVAIVRRAACLKIVNADIGSQMHVPSRFSHQRLDMAAAALAFAVEHCLASRCCRAIKTPPRRCRRMQ